MCNYYFPINHLFVWCCRQSETDTIKKKTVNQELIKVPLSNVFHGCPQLRVIEHKGTTTSWCCLLVSPAACDSAASVDRCSCSCDAYARLWVGTREATVTSAVRSERCPLWWCWNTRKRSTLPESLRASPGGGRLRQDDSAFFSPLQESLNFFKIIITLNDVWLNTVAPGTSCTLCLYVWVPNNTFGLQIWWLITVTQSFFFFHIRHEHHLAITPQTQAHTAFKNKTLQMRRWWSRLLKMQ